VYACFQLIILVSEETPVVASSQHLNFIFLGGWGRVISHTIISNATQTLASLKS